MVRRIGIALLSALALIVLLIAAAFGLAQTGYGKRVIASQLGALLTTPDLAVAITGIEGLVPVNMRIGRVTAADGAGVWLEVDDLQLAWSPGALLGGRIRIDRLSAGRVALDRLPPSAPSDTPPEPIRMPELPEWLPPTSLQQLEVAQIDLGRDVLGTPASFALTGSLAMPDDGGSATLALDLERTDQTTAAVTLDATLQLEPPALDLSLRAHEEGGLLAALTGEAEAKSLVLELAGKGPLDAWKGELHADAKGLGRADAAVGIALDDQLALSIDGALLPADGVLPADLAAALGDRLGLALAVVQTGPQQLRIEHLRATAKNAELTADGTVDLEAEQFRVGAGLALSDLAGLSTLAGTPLAGALKLDLNAEGGFMQPKGSLKLEGTGLGAAGISVERLTSAFAFAAGEPLTAGLRGLTLTGDGKTEGLVAPDLAPLPLDDLAWQIDVLARQEDAIDLKVLRLSMADVVLAVQGEADPQTLAATGQVDLKLGSLARFAAPYGQAVDGAVTLHADVVAADQAKQVEAKLKGAIDRLSGLPPGAAELLGTAVDLAATVTLRPESRLQVEDLALKGDAVSLDGNVALSLPEQGLDGVLTMRLPRLAVLEPVAGQPLDGAIEIDATLAGSVDAPDLQLTARGSDLVLADRKIAKLALQATARGPTSAPAGKIELTVTTAGVDASLSTAYQLRDQQLALTDLALVAPRSRVDGTLTVDLERTLIDGDIKGRVQDLAGLGPLLPMPLSGAVDLDAELRPQAAGQAAEVSVTVRDLAGGDLGALRRLQANAKVNDALGKPAIEARASAEDFRQGDLHVATLGLNVDGTLEQLGVRSTVKGEMVEPFDLQTRVQVGLGEAVKLRIEQLSGRVAGNPLRLARATEVTLGDAIRLSGLDLEVLGARITADASMAANQVTLDAALQDLALAELETFGVPALDGEANAQLRMRGPVGDPGATLDLTVTGLHAADPAFDDLPPAQLTARAELASRRLRLDVRGEGVTDKPMVLTAALPVSLQLQPFAFALPDGPVTGSLDAEILLARLADIAGLDDDRLEGLLTVALKVGGSFEEPQLDGTIDITDGIYENGLSGTVLHAMTLHATARQQRLTINELSANDGGSGTVSGQGYVDIDPAASFPMDVQITLTRAQLVQTTEATATISGNLALNGDVAAAKLEGKLTVDQAEIYLPDQVGPSVPTIQVEEAGAPAAKSGSGGGGSSFDLGLDVTVALPGRTFVRGRGLESEWEGKITAKGTASKPRLTGSLSIKRGYFDLLDQRFNLSRGVIAFNGESPPNPTIDLEATAKAGDVTGIIKVEGPATKPDLTLDSEPPLPEDEVLSRIMFNRAANEISPIQAVQLAAAVNRLRGGGPGVLDQIRGVLGVDTLDVGGGDDTGTTVKAGKYLSDNVYVEGETGTADQSSKARVEVEILPNLSLQAETGADANSGVGVKWKYDY